MNNQPTQIYLSLGSNLGNRRRYLEQAQKLLAGKIANLGASPLYETEPWGKTDQPKFLNCCLGGTTRLSPTELLGFVKGIEQQLGRQHREKWGPREIDIDILFYGNRVIENGDLIIPHPHVAERAFVLVPLAAIAPDFIHPQLHRTVNQLVTDIDTSSITTIS